MSHILHSCEEHDCFVCTGGLGFCTVCGGAEASLPTECPGEKMDEIVQQQIMRGDFDFVGGKWVNKLSVDLSKLPPGYDWMIGCTNGGLTIYAQIGKNEMCFGDTIQQAVDAAVAHLETAASSETYWYHPESDSYFTCRPGEDGTGDGLAHEISRQQYEDGLRRQQRERDGLLV